MIVERVQESDGCKREPEKQVWKGRKQMEKKLLIIDYNFGETVSISRNLTKNNFNKIFQMVYYKSLKHLIL